METTGDRIASDCRMALQMLDDLEALLAGGWPVAAGMRAAGILRTLVTAYLTEVGPSIGLATWLEDQQRPVASTGDAARELRAALVGRDLVPAVLAAHDLGRAIRAALDPRAVTGASNSLRAG